MQGIAGILLAAGSSTRFGSPKLLHELASGQCVGLQSGSNLSASINNCVVVCHPAHLAVQSLFVNAGMRVVINKDADSGMASSIACGVRAISDADGVVIALADMPYICSKTFLNVAHKLESGAPIVVPSYNNRIGHPVGFGKQFFHALCSLHGDVGARRIISDNSDLVHIINVNDDSILRDIDFPFQEN